MNYTGKTNNKSGFDEDWGIFDWKQLEIPFVTGQEGETVL